LSWRDVATAATLSLALAAPAGSPARERAQASVVQAADRLLALRSRQGFAIAFAPGPGDSVPWGSNSYVVNNALLLATAYDLRRDSRYLAGALSALDYVLGENPLDQSYVTGYGARPVRHPHHRFFAHSRRADLPEVPRGFLAGGPNSGLQDPVARAQLSGCAPLGCFLDDLDSYSTNEVAINWNAPLAWLASFADDWAHALDASARPL
jgi:endoglucanase